MSTNDQRLAADIAACQSVPELQQQLRDRDIAIEALATEIAAKSRCLSFFACVIKSGEPWTATCESEYTVASQSPATDAFINAVRAEGVEMLAANHQRIVDTLNGDSLFADGERRHAAIAAAAVHFAAQLRAGKDGE